MAHPRTYDLDDPLLHRLREVLLRLPESTEKEAWGRPTFRAGKMFAIYERHDEGTAVVLKPAADERAALLEDDRFYVPPYHGAYGWLGLDLHADVDWDEVAELAEDSYRQVALKRMLTALDAAGPS